ncbi:DUF3169 family protein [Streptococcus sp. IMAU 99161]|uniref:DUF3169 family protein n=1 Tax=Streptococcus sp. IMAU 99161 TaxID=2710601 RepID=UPI00165649CA|nr:DUF3169 family protein [Streptococcus sp. IMAU 99161]MBC8776365.1 DUF3169 family protein [Streptococcus sp. IMAU 99161]
MKVKKKLKERSSRFRFWRNMAMFLSGVIVSFLIELVGSDHPIEIQKLFDRDMLYIGSIILYLVSFGIASTYLISSRQSYQMMEETEDEDEAYRYESQTRRIYDLATIFKGVMIVPYLLVIFFSCQKLVYEEKLTGTLGKYTIPFVFLALLFLTFGLEHQFRKTFKQIYGKAIPRNSSGAEVRELMMSMMDEAEKQICYEENFDIVFKLSNYVLPISLMVIILVGITFQTDILLALVVVSLIYIYILVSQYKITKRYYKE